MGLGISAAECSVVQDVKCLAGLQQRQAVEFRVSLLSETGPEIHPGAYPCGWLDDGEGASHLHPY